MLRDRLTPARKALLCCAPLDQTGLPFLEL